MEPAGPGGKGDEKIPGSLFPVEFQAEYVKSALDDLLNLMTLKAQLFKDEVNL